MEPIWALGFMSGTSLDGIDAAYILSDGTHVFEKGPTYFLPYSASFRQQLKQCFGQSHRNPFIRDIEQQLTKMHGNIANKMIASSSIKPQLIGFHGQTIFHAPPQTLQIGDGNLLAALTNVAVVYDFRTNDCLNGGQGAPLVPIYHQALTQKMTKPVAVLNIGGVGNITGLGKENSLIAFDTGPGNALIDDYVLAAYGVSFDVGGAIAASGKADVQRVAAWMTDPFFNQPFPKSLGRDYFTSLKLSLNHLAPNDAVATLTLFTAQSIILACLSLPEKPQQLVLCGGGAKNLTLAQLIQEGLPGVAVVRADNIGWRGDFIEAEAFAFLAIRHFYDLPLSFPLTTGVKVPLTGGSMCSIK